MHKEQKRQEECFPNKYDIVRWSNNEVIYEQISDYDQTRLYIH